MTNVSLSNTSNDGYETYNSKYSKDSVELYITLPKLTSTLTYEIEITNKTDYSYAICNIESTNSDSNIVYEMDYGVGTVINGNTTLVISITYKYDSSVIELSDDKTTISNIEFTFEHPTASMLAYDNTNTGIECDNVQCALDYIDGKLN